MQMFLFEGLVVGRAYKTRIISGWKIPPLRPPTAPGPTLQEILANSAENKPVFGHDYYLADDSGDKPDLRWKELFNDVNICLPSQWYYPLRSPFIFNGVPTLRSMHAPQVTSHFQFAQYSLELATQDNRNATLTVLSTGYSRGTRNFPSYHRNSAISSDLLVCPVMNDSLRSRVIVSSLSPKAATKWSVIPIKFPGRQRFSYFRLCPSAGRIVCWNERDGQSGRRNTDAMTIYVHDLW
jgi:hypothetical protein